MVRSLFLKFIFLSAILWSLANTGCTHFSDLMGTKNESGKKSVSDESPQFVKFSENPAVLAPSARQYRRMTRSKMEEESDLGSQAGSMWVGEGQGAYLFSQNKTRREGDLLNVKLEGAGQKQVETKVSVIKKLLKQLEEEEAKANQPEMPLAQEGANPKKPEAARAPASEKKEEKDEPLDIGTIPTKITERQADGNYRIKGQHPFMIGQREYKVIVTGAIRPEDFNDEGISSGKILDPQYDVVSIRRSQTK